MLYRSIDDLGTLTPKVTQPRAGFLSDCPVFRQLSVYWLLYAGRHINNPDRTMNHHSFYAWRYIGTGHNKALTNPDELHHSPTPTVKSCTFVGGAAGLPNALQKQEKKNNTQTHKKMDTQKETNMDA